MIYARFLYINETLINQLLAVQHVSFLSIDIQLLCKRLSYKSVSAYATMSKGFLGDGG